MRIIIDIDSALVQQGNRGRRHSIPEAVAKAIALCKEHRVTLWSKHGLRYTRRFAKDNGLVARCANKPDSLISKL